MAVLKRALALASRGVLVGTALSLATAGVLQLPESSATTPPAKPYVKPFGLPGAGGSYELKIDYAIKHVLYESEIKILLENFESSRQSQTHAATSDSLIKIILTGRAQVRTLTPIVDVRHVELEHAVVKIFDSSSDIDIRPYSTSEYWNTPHEDAEVISNVVDVNYASEITSAIDTTYTTPDEHYSSETIMLHFAITANVSHGTVEEIEPEEIEARSYVDADINHVAVLETSISVAYEQADEYSSSTDAVFSVHDTIDTTHETEDEVSYVRAPSSNFILDGESYYSVSYVEPEIVEDNIEELIEAFIAVLLSAEDL